MLRKPISITPFPAAVMHLVSVWNPSYANDAMEEHLAILLREASATGDDVLESESVYVWWGKVRSPNRQQPQANLGDIRRLATQRDAALGAQVHSGQGAAGERRRTHRGARRARSTLARPAGACDRRRARA